MIIADSKKLLFVHIYKTGGSSITSLLAPYISEEFRHKNPQTSGDRWQKSWHFDRRQHSKFAKALAVLEQSDIDLNLDDYLEFVFVRNPYSWVLSIWNNFYSSARRNLPDTWDNKLKFALRGVLNKKLDSQYFYEMYPDGGFKNFVLFIDQIVNHNPQLTEKVWGATDQYSFIENDRQIKFDFIGRFENLQADLQHISNVANAEQLSQMPQRASSTYRRDRQDYLSYYDSQLIAIVNQIFARDFQAFDYQPIEV
ncbi:MAG: sulfotransferase family 2 domain-containing protein [Cyanobacteria bacterium J06643_13]